MTEFVNERAAVLETAVNSKGSDLSGELNKLPPGDPLAKVGLYAHHLGISLQQAMDPKLGPDDYLELADEGRDDA